MLTVKKQCYVAILSALFVLLDLLSISIGNSMKITFGGLPIIVAGIFLGPIPGMLVGLLGSFIGQLLSFGLSATTILWIIPAGIRGLTVGLMFIAFRRNCGMGYLGFTILVSSILVTFFNTLVMLIDSIIYGYYSFEVVFGLTLYRVIASILTSVAYLAIIVPVVRALNRYSRNALLKF